MEDLRRRCEICKTALDFFAPRPELSRRPRRHLRLAFADPPFQSADRRFRRGHVRPPKEGTLFRAAQGPSINFDDPKAAKQKILFDNLTPLYPQEKFNLEAKTGGMTTRIIDLIAPIGKGQRALITSPPKAANVLLKDVANAISEGNPEAYLIVLLIDERPEEVTDMQRQ